MRKLNLIAGIAAIALVFPGLEACKDAGKADEGPKDNQKQDPDSQYGGHGQMQKEEIVGNTPDGHKEFASPLINQYLQIKDALAGDNSAEASKAATEFTKQLDAVEIKALPQEEQDKAGAILEQARIHAIQISGNGIAQQREQFEQLSRQIIFLIEITGSHIPLYEQYCPMYNKNKGGVWLSSSEKILNPYFGSSMLSCGMVRGEYN